MARIDTIDRETDIAFLLFYSVNDLEGLTRLQKLLFLIEEESELSEEFSDLSFDFEAYKFGPFSEQVYDEIELLVNMGAVKVVDPDYDVNEYLENPNGSEFAGKKLVLTKKGEKIAEELCEVLDDSLEKDLEDLVSKYGSMSSDDLLEYVYRQYPEYTENSEIKEEVLE